jgi:hypothetical protein
MKKWITPEQVMELSPAGQAWLARWHDDHTEFDDDLVRVFIPEEKAGEFGGVFTGFWDRECEFIYPERYNGKLKHHQGTILPLLDIGQMIEILAEEFGAFSRSCIPDDSTPVCEALWIHLKQVLEDELV